MLIKALIVAQVLLKLGDIQHMLLLNWSQLVKNFFLDVQLKTLPCLS